MNAGFSNLTTLKASLLTPALRASTDFDNAITTIGLGIANLFEKECDRQFARAVATTEIFGADRCQFLLSRIPVESVAQVELKLNETDGFIVQTPSPIVTVDNAAGIVYLPDGADFGPYTAQARFTYTGGYAWEQLEPNDPASPTAVPSGAAALPAALLSAWLLQCEIVWKMRDKLGLDIIGAQPKSRGPLYQINDLDLAPIVKTMLQHYKRYQLT
jgi:hypothetical protein